MAGKSRAVAQERWDIWDMCRDVGRPGAWCPPPTPWDFRSALAIWDMLMAEYCDRSTSGVCALRARPATMAAGNSGRVEHCCGSTAVGELMGILLQ